MADNRIAYGLAKKYGIDTDGMSPKEVWEALEKKGVKELGGHRDEVYYKSAEELKEQQEIKSLPPAYGFASKTRKNTKHHKDHAKEMGFKNQDEYEKGAKNFWESIEGEVYYSKAKDRYYKYSKQTGEFVAVSDDGIILTYLKYTEKKFKKVKQQDEVDDL